MKISECIPGDMLVIDDHGQAVYVELGNLLGYRNKKALLVHMALVTTFDPDTGRRDASTWRAVAPDTEVIAVHETYARRRMLRAMNPSPVERARRAAGGVIDDSEVDPMLKKQGGGF